MMLWFGAIAGGLLAAVFGGVAGLFYGAVLGALAGALLNDRIKAEVRRQLAALQDNSDLAELRARLDRLEAEVASARRPVATHAAAAAAAMDEASAAGFVDTDVLPITASGATPPRAAIPVAVPAPLPAPAPDLTPVPALADDARDVTVRPATRSRQPAPPVRTERLSEKLFSGNLVAKIGVVILFCGVGFLLKYAYEHAVLPPSLRVAGIALAGMVMLGIAWRQLPRRRAYALVLMGGAMGLAYLDVFFALRMFGLVGPGPAFALFIVLGVATMLLAARADSEALAGLGLLGAFLAPLLASTSNGDHIVLFSYYVLLNLFILGVSGYKAWRVLNLTGFLFTFFIATAWGVLRYTPALFASAEVFLIAFFCIYTAIPILYARLRNSDVGDGGPVGQGMVDATLVFGTPTACAFLQAALVRGMGDDALAMSAAVAGCVYALLVVLLRRRPRMELLVQTHAALATVLLTLALYFAFDPYPTFALWTLEGAAIVWIGLRQKRRLAFAFGVALQVAAAWLFAGDAVHQRYDHPVLNPFTAGCALIAVASWISAWLIWRQRRDADADVHAAGLMRGNVLALLELCGVAWGGVWWLIGMTRMLHDTLGAGATFAHAWLLGLALSLLAADGIGAVLGWTMARRAAALLPLGLLLIFVVDVDAGVALDGPGWLTWVAALASAWVNLRVQERAGVALFGPARHLVLTWLPLALLIHTGTLAVDAAGWGVGWRWAVVGAPAAALLCLLAWLRGRVWPVNGARLSLYLGGVVMPLMWLVSIWCVVANLAGDGSATPWTYWPVLNPLDLAQGLTLLVLLAWRDAVAVLLQTRRRHLDIGIGIIAFISANGMLLRALHHGLGVAFNLHTLLANATISTTLSLAWTLAATALMTWGVRRARREEWIAGATLLGAVVLKLLFNDLGNVGSVARIVSFIGVGVLLLVIGYAAPLPPARDDNDPDDRVRAGE